MLARSFFLLSCNHRQHSVYGSSDVAKTMSIVSVLALNSDTGVDLSIIDFDISYSTVAEAQCIENFVVFVF
jgi:hypothetical protein